MHAYVYNMGYWLIQWRYELILLEACIRIYTIWDIGLYSMRKHVKKHLEFQNIWMRYLN